MQKGLFGLLLAPALFFFHGADAHAQNRGFADDGRVVIGAERLTGVFIEKINTVETTVTGGMTPDTIVDETDFSTTSFALLGQSTSLDFGGAFNVGGGPSATPRFGVDVFVWHGLSVGGSLMYTTSSGSFESTETVNGMPQPPDPEEDQDSVNLFIFHPRVGYGYAISPLFAIWPRAGFSYARYGVHEENLDPGPPPVNEETDTTITATDLTLEFMLAITPVPNVAILVGPLVDIGLGGGIDVEESPPPMGGGTTETDVTYTAFGLSAGLGVVF